MELKPQQKQAIAAIKRFLDSDNSVFILKGYAGTGKTTLIKPVIALASSAGKSCQLMAPTGRAAKILSDKAGAEATTIHKAIYELSNIEAIEGDEKNESKIEYRFPLRQLGSAKRPGGPVSPDKALLIIDESSMISSRKNVGDLFIFGSGILLDDLIKYARIKDGGKILFVGDPAQLPPVGDPDSYALDQDFLTSKGLKVDWYELTDVVRQDSDSKILSNSIKLRRLIQSQIRTELILDRKEGEVEDIDSSDIATRFCEFSPIPSITEPVVICYSNKSVAAYNNWIRGRYYPGPSDSLQVGDILIIVGNNYTCESRAVLNGEFATVIDFSGILEKQEGFVYVDDGTDKKKRIKMELSFRDVVLQFDDGKTVKKKIFESLLWSGQPNITYQEQCALMSNFNMRHKGLRPKSPEYIKAMLEDPYYNALRAKFGYAVTCHKAQGGEWDTVFVDFSGRTGLNKDSLRWSYTAMTRSSRRMFGYGLHNIPQYKAKVTDIIAISNISDEYYPASANVSTGPFSREDDPTPLKAKYWQIAESLAGTGYTVSGIEHLQWCERYLISDIEGHVFKCDSAYNKAGIMRPFRAVNPVETPSEILLMMHNAPEYEYQLEYTPANCNLNDLYAKIRSICDSNEITIVNIVEHLNNYKAIYYLKTDADYALLEVCINKYGQITYIAPKSEVGAQDLKLVKLVEELKQ